MRCFEATLRFHSTKQAGGSSYLLFLSVFFVFPPLRNYPLVPRTCPDGDERPVFASLARKHQGRGCDPAGGSHSLAVTNNRRDIAFFEISTGASQVTTGTIQTKNRSASYRAPMRAQTCSPLFKDQSAHPTQRCDNAPGKARALH